jgi:glycosyltransferase involved in cell wall biosynthesis
MFAFLQVLLQEGMTVKFWPDTGCYLADYTEMLQDMGVEVCYGASAGSFDEWIAVNGSELDAVLLSRPVISAKYIHHLWLSTNATLIFYGHDLHFARMRAQAELTGDAALAKAAEEMQQTEIAVWRQSDVVLYPSTEEAAVVAAMAPGTPVHAVVPFAFERFAEPRSPAPGADLLFVAGFAHPPNEDAAVWFSSEIFPIVRKTVPSAHLILAGSNPSEAVSRLAGRNVSVASNLSDAELATLYSRARVAVVPLRFGAGVKLKVIEALREGVPLVTTPVGVQGCSGLDGVVAVHSDPADFAQAVSRLLTDDVAWMAASEQQVAYAKQNFSQERLRSALLQASGL